MRPNWLKLAIWPRILDTVEPQSLEHRWFVYYGWFELVLESLGNSSDSSRKQIFKKIFLFYHEIVCGDSNEYTQHTIIV